MPRGKRTRYLIHRNGFEDTTAYVRYEGDVCYLVTVERVDRELRSDMQRVEAGLWRELSEAQAAKVLRQKRGATFVQRSARPLSEDAVDPADGIVEG